MRRLGFPVVVLCAGLLSACAVGPGMPLIEALDPRSPDKTGTVQPPKGYGQPTGTEVARGLINTQDRAATAEYLKTLAKDGESVQGAPVSPSLAE